MLRQIGDTDVFMLQISKVVGARVVAVARGKAKADALRDMGADVVIDSAAHKDEPLRKLIKVFPIEACPWGILARGALDSGTRIHLRAKPQANVLQTGFFAATAIKAWLSKQGVSHSEPCKTVHLTFLRCLRLLEQEGSLQKLTATFAHFWFFFSRGLSFMQNAAPRGIDVVFDPVGGSALNEALKCVRWSAHVLFIGFASGHIPKASILVLSCSTILFP